MLVKTINNVITGPASAAGPNVVELTESQAEILKSNYKSKIVKYENGVLVIEEPVKVHNWKEHRIARNKLLLEADNWAEQIGDKKILGEDVSAELLALAQYRKDLRDITINFESPDKVVWPQKPWEAI